MIGNEISFHSASVDFSPPDIGDLRRWLTDTVTNENKIPGALSYVFCSDEFLLSINRKYLHHHDYTDVITFDFGDAEEVSGEIYISIDRIRDNASKYNVTFRDELHRVMIHGLLHLLGYADSTREAKAEMTGKEDYYLSLRTF